MRYINSRFTYLLTYIPKMCLCAKNEVARLRHSLLLTVANEKKYSNSSRLPTRTLSRSRCAADKTVAPPPFGPRHGNCQTVILHHMPRQKLLIQMCKKCRAATRLIMIRCQFYLLVNRLLLLLLFVAGLQ